MARLFWFFQRTFFKLSALISDPPEIEVDQSWIPNEEGIEAEVSCNIYAEPPADVSVY